MIRGLPLALRPRNTGHGFAPVFPVVPSAEVRDNVVIPLISFMLSNIFLHHDPDPGSERFYVMTQSSWVGYQAPFHYYVCARHRIPTICMGHSQGPSTRKPPPAGASPTKSLYRPHQRDTEGDPDLPGLITIRS